MGNRKLQVWWIPQIPMGAFTVPVSNLIEAKLLLDTLANYDLFQYKNEIKPDYSNAGGLHYWDDVEEDWCDWYLEETGEDFDEYIKRLNKEGLLLQ